MTHPLHAFFPHTFDTLPVSIAKPAPKWDDDDGTWEEETKETYDAPPERITTDGDQTT